MIRHGSLGDQDNLMRPVQIAPPGRNRSLFRNDGHGADELCPVRCFAGVLEAWNTQLHISVRQSLAGLKEPHR